MRNEQRYEVIELMLRGKSEGRHGPGRKRDLSLKNIRTWFATTTKELFRAAANKVRISNIQYTVKDEHQRKKFTVSLLILWG